MQAIKIDALTKTTSTGFRLDVPHLELSPGNIYGLVGPNGAGKTTLMKCLCGLFNPDSGNLEIDNQRVAMNDVTLLKKIGTNFIHSDSLKGFKLSEIYEDHRFYYDLGKEISIEQLLENVGLNIHRELEFNKMSLGMKQRFLLGMATVHNPTIILLDEPFNGLDPDGVDLFIKEIQALSKGRILIVSSHVLHDMETFLDEVIFIDSGRIEGTKSLSAIRKDYKKGLKAYYDEQKHKSNNQ